jgi:predicted RNA methylase
MIQMTTREEAITRFQFGENWTRLLSVVDEDRVTQAVARLSEMLGDIRSKSFFDVGSGSGIHSLAALRLGALRVVSFDYDSKSVACTAELKRRFATMSDWVSSLALLSMKATCVRLASSTSSTPGASSTTRAQCGKASIS